MGTKKAGHKIRMQQRKARRIADTLRAKGVPELEAKARAISEVSGIPVEGCKEQLLQWMDELPDASCALASCDGTASRYASSQGTPLCWRHAGLWTQSAECLMWRRAGAKSEDKPAALMSFLRSFGGAHRLPGEPIRYAEID